MLQPTKRIPQIPPKKMHGEFQGGLRLSRIQPKKRRKASVEMHCAPWLRRSVSCLRARFHLTLFWKSTQRGIQNPSLLFHEGWQRWKCYFEKEGLFKTLWVILKCLIFLWICFRFLICKVWNSETIWNSWMNYSNVSRPRYATWFIE